MHSTETVAARMARLGIKLPTPNVPSANYVPTRLVGHILFVSGQVPRVEGANLFVGKVGRDITQEAAKEAARVCALNIVAQLHTALEGDLDRVKSCLRLRGFVNATEDFQFHPAVINGASDLIVEVFGDRGRHARTALGVGSLPNGFSVEVDADFEISV